MANNRFRSNARTDYVNQAESKSIMTPHYAQRGGETSGENRKGPEGYP